MSFVNESGDLVSSESSASGTHSDPTQNTPPTEARASYLTPQPLTPSPYISSRYNGSFFFAQAEPRPIYYPSPAVLACIRNPERFSRRYVPELEARDRSPTTDVLQRQGTKCSSNSCSAPNSLHESPKAVTPAETPAGTPPGSPMLRAKQSFQNFKKSIWKRKKVEEKKERAEASDESPDAKAEEDRKDKHPSSASQNPNADSHQPSDAKPPIDNAQNPYNLPQGTRSPTPASRRVAILRAQLGIADPTRRSKETEVPTQSPDEKNIIDRLHALATKQVVRVRARIQHFADSMHSSKEIAIQSTSDLKENKCSIAVKKQVARLRARILFATDCPCCSKMREASMASTGEEERKDTVLACRADSTSSEKEIVLSERKIAFPDTEDTRTKRCEVLRKRVSVLWRRKVKRAVGKGGEESAL